jgi:hypothetical protein
VIDDILYHAFLNAAHMQFHLMLMPVPIRIEYICPSRFSFSKALVAMTIADAFSKSGRHLSIALSLLSNSQGRTISKRGTLNQPSHVGDFVKHFVSSL